MKLVSNKMAQNIRNEFICALVYYYYNLWLFTFNS
jgi:hypothetical protein